MDFINCNEFASLQNIFWLQILGDHSRFLLNATPPFQSETASKAAYFKELFDTLLDKSRSSLSDEDLRSFNIQCLNAACEIRAFKLNILKLTLTQKIKFNLSQTFLNHMINEVEEYIFILNTILKNQVPAKHPIHYHLLWLSDAYAHSSILASTIDMAEKPLLNTIKEFEKDFDNLYIKAVEINGYMRTSLTNFPSLYKFNYDVDAKMLLFQQFLNELRNLSVSKEILGSITPLIPDHMFREECYYIFMLSTLTSLSQPDCNFAEPRIE